MNVGEPDEANETMEDLTDEQLEQVAGGKGDNKTGQINNFAEFFTCN